MSPILPCAFAQGVFRRAFCVLKRDVVFLEGHLNSKMCREDALSLLQKKQAELNEKGDKRYPKRSDFSEQEVVAIKSFLGPWPRALEAAGLKMPRSDDRVQKMAEKRIRIKQQRNRMRREAASKNTQ